MSNDNSSSYNFGNLLYTLIGIAVAFVGYNIHHSIFWAIVDWFFWPIALLKWLICSEVNITIIKGAFAFFLS